MTTNELREAFQRFYEERGHLRVPGHSLIPPAEDQTTLFIIAGMQQFKPYFLRTSEPPSDRVVSVQPCLRAGGKDNDLDEVGRTERHCSFFEMMGNFSFGDYYKDEAVDFAWDWVTQVLGLEPERLWATVHEGDPLLELEEDTVAIEAWQRVGIPPERIVRLGKDNFWQAGETGPCGQCTEIFYDRGEAYACGDPNCGPGHCDRIMEIYNLVFMAYDLQPGNLLVHLPTPNVDTGNGIERTACVLQGVSSVFDTDGFQVIMDWIERESGVAYNDSEVSRRAHRVLADHGRAVSVPDRRRASSRRTRGAATSAAVCCGVRSTRRSASAWRTCTACPRSSSSRWATPTRCCASTPVEIERIVRAEEERFSETLARGMKVFDDLAGQDAISADDAFVLVATYGFPIELTEELAEERGQAVDVDGFRDLMEEHREISRGGGDDSTQQRGASSSGPGKRADRVRRLREDRRAHRGDRYGPGERDPSVVKLEQSPFYAAERWPGDRPRVPRRRRGNGQLDVVDVLKFGDDQVLVVDFGAAFAMLAGTRVQAVVNWRERFPTQANHTATHLLHQALRDVLGDHVKQAGSAVRPDKLRFDFTHEQTLTPEERDRVERIVNDTVFEAIPVRTYVTPIEEARKLGAMMLFGEKYGDEVRVVEIGDYSAELCGGTHVRSTAEIGSFRIIGEGSVGSGARRIEAVTSGEAWTLLEGRSRELDDVRGELEELRRAAKKPKQAEEPGRTSCGRTSKGRSSWRRWRVPVAVPCVTCPTSSASAREPTQSCSPRQTTGRSRSS